MKILICGSRNWSDSGPIFLALRSYDPNDTIVVHGDARGADRLGAKMARLRGIPKENIRPYPADWDKHGRSAGPVRNQQMLDEEKPDLVLAFRSAGKSNGTDDMVRRAREAGVPVQVVMG